jgi:hypothetical protein
MGPPQEDITEREIESPLREIRSRPTVIFLDGHSSVCFDCHRNRFGLPLNQYAG